MIIKNKICYACKLKKSINKFYINPNNKDGYSGSCKKCINIKNSQWAKKNKDHLNKYQVKWRLKHKYSTVNTRLKYVYNITLDKKNKMILDQKGKCASCGDVLGVNPRNIHIDHNHKTGKIRKILCQKCNASLGFMEENVKKILGLLKYAQYCNKIR